MHCADYGYHRINIQAAMPCKKSIPLLQQRQSPKCPLFRLPGELRNIIYELVFENGNDTISVADFVSAPAKAGKHVGPPSSALVRSCQKIHDETKSMFAVAYRRFWQKSFVVDLRDVYVLSYYMKHVPTAWIRSYILIMDTGYDDAPTEVVLSRSCGKWQATARENGVFKSGNSYSELRKTTKGFLRDAHTHLKRFNDRMLYAKPRKWCSMNTKTKAKKTTNKKFTRKDNKAKTKAKRVESEAYKAWKKRPKTSTDVHGAPAGTSPMSGPLTKETLYHLMRPAMGGKVLHLQRMAYQLGGFDASWCEPYTNSQLSRWMASEDAV